MDLEPHPHPSLLRLALAFVLAPAIPSFVCAMLNGPRAFFVILSVAYACAVVLGLPAYAILRSRVRPTALNSMIAGGFVATVPWMLLILANGNPDSASTGGHATVIDGVTTWHGHVETALAIGEIFLLGALGGLTFWLAALGIGSRSMRAEGGQGSRGPAAREVSSPDA
jgi:hypothetical protein